MGKSRLVEELAAGAARARRCVLVGRCVDLGDGELPYAPIAGALRALPALLGRRGGRDVFGPARGRAGRLVPGLAEASDERPAPRPARSASARLFELLLGVLGRARRRGAPVLLVIEDLHWADGSTRDLLRFLVRSAARERLRWSLTYRTDDLHRAHPLRPYLVELGRDPRVTRIALRPFSRAELADHVRDAARGAAERGGARPAVRALGGQRVLHRGAARAAGTEDAGRLPRLAARGDARAARAAAGPRAAGRARGGGRRTARRLSGCVARDGGLAERRAGGALREAVDAQVLVPHGATRTSSGTRCCARRLRRGAAGRARGAARRAGGATSRRGPELAGAGTALRGRARPSLARRRASASAPSRRPCGPGRRPSASTRIPRRCATSSARSSWPSAAGRGRPRRAHATRAAGAANAAGEHALAVALGRRAIELATRAEPLRAGLLHARLART